LVKVDLTLDMFGLLVVNPKDIIQGEVDNKCYNLLEANIKLLDL